MEFFHADFLKLVSLTEGFFLKNHHLSSKNDPIIHILQPNRRDFSPGDTLSGNNCLYFQRFVIFSF